MINHVSIGVADLRRAKVFYNAVLNPLGYRLCSDSDEALGYGKEAAVLWIIQVETESDDRIRPGLHICFDAPNRNSVEAFHKAALAHGGTDNGAPGLRPDYGPGYFAAFVVDPEGYRLEAYCGS